MPAIWTLRADPWRPLEVVPYDNERALYNLVAQAPHLLPLSGSPELLVVGVEVRRAVVA